MISEIETSSVRDENFQRIKVPAIELVEDKNEDGSVKLDENNNPILIEQTIKNEDGTDKLFPIFVNSHKYLLYLLKNDKVGFLQLLSIYLQELINNNDFKTKLNNLI